jgi:hypothetical protein
MMDRADGTSQADGTDAGRRQFQTGAALASFIDRPVLQRRMPADRLPSRLPACRLEQRRTPSTRMITGDL